MPRRFYLFSFYLSHSPQSTSLTLLVLPLSLFSICLSHSPQSTSLTLLNLPLSLSSIYLSHSPRPTSLTLLNLPLSLSFVLPFSLPRALPTLPLSHFISFHRTVPSFSPPSLPILISSYIMVSFSSSLLALIFLFSSCSQFEIFSLHPTSISRALFFSHLSHSPSYSTLLSPFLPYFPYPPSC